LRRKGEEGTTVQQSKAKAELAQHLATDPLYDFLLLLLSRISISAFCILTLICSFRPLRKAKVTLEAARKKAEKARAPFDAATKAAEAARASAEDALEQTRKRVDEAEAYLAEVKAKPGTPHGAIWWLEEELKEQKSYLPERKGGVRKNV